ncbi:cache domain-containing sensor histidine kinase [Cohnella lupini]|uniref:Two-component system sensor histidine kinase YesM n=1 Tax=Cohnella lupini TaxID=1294267 RepID=A0A3D9IV72_9BACL|nr:sensor histidine kinase [Cohnella lupini]RED65547.1 two-component system sensor histidine kinase YesM [Cohnella lupini]
MSAKLKNPLTRLNVRQQLILLFLVLVSPVFLLNWYANTKAEQILKEHVTSAYEELNKQNHFLINRDIDTVSRLMTTIIQNSMTQSMISNEQDAQFDRVVKYREMNTLLGNNTVGLFEGEAIYFFLFVYDPNNNYQFAPSVPDINRQINGSSVFFYSDQTKTPWIEEALKAKGKGVLSIIDNFGPRGNQRTLAYLRTVNSITNGRSVVGVLVATKMDKKTEESFSTVSLPEGGEMYLTDWSDRILASTTSEMGKIMKLPPELDMDSLEETISSVYEESIYVVHTKYSLKQKLVYKIPTKSLLQQQSALKQVIQTISIVYSLFAIVVMMYFWRSLMNPLRKLAMFARSHEPGKPLSSSPTKERNDEVGVLIYSVHNMANRINDMIHDQYFMEIKQKESQLQLLYQQINPHLLYNTLESIYWKSSLEGNTGSAEMIKELSKLMRISLSRGRELITIEEELEHATAYTSLQQKRYEYGFTIKWDISDEVRNYWIPKITLQPLIENAIIHGVINMGEDGEIIVTARSDDDNVVITVEDNGYKETDHDAINRLIVNEPSDGASGYGIRNVNKRIQLHFGNVYGLRYEARETEGTRVTVIIPKRTGEHYKEAQ